MGQTIAIEQQVKEGEGDSAHLTTVYLFLFSSVEKKNIPYQRGEMAQTATTLIFVVVAAEKHKRRVKWA